MAITKLKDFGTLSFNYKGFGSIIISAIPGADYKLKVVVGASGSDCDCGVFSRSELHTGLSQGSTGFSEIEQLPTCMETGYFLVGDDGNRIFSGQG